MISGLQWRVGLAMLAAVGIGTGTAFAYIQGDGKGKAEADCFVGLEGYAPDDQTPFGKKGKPAIQCTDCDPACDLDGAATPNGSCTFSIAVAVNQTGVTSCTPTPLKKVVAKAKAKGGSKLLSKNGDFGTLPIDGTSAVGSFVDFTVPVKKFGSPKAKAGKGNLSLLGTKPKDKDKFTFVCNPLPEGEVCPSATTSTTLASTSTTLATTSTTIATTSTTLATTSTTLGTTSTTLATTTTTLATTTTTLATTSTTLGTTSTTIATTSTTLATTSTTIATTTTTIATTTTTIVGTLTFRTGAAGGTCGESRTGGSTGTVIKNLTCGGLNIGGGGSTVPEGPTPDNADTIFNVSCSGSTCTVSARTSAETGTNNNCSATGCNFGPRLSIANGGLSTCVLNTFQAGGSGTLDTSTGAFNGSVPLTSTVTVTGNNAAPCPDCIAGACSATASNSGASCTAINSSGDSYECLPSGSGLAPFGVNLTPIGTGTQTATGPTFCPGQDATAPGLNGCFGDPTCDYIEARGVHATGITVGGGATAANLASVFCIPATGNGLIDGAADLPGPGETTLPGTLNLIGN